MPAESPETPNAEFAHILFMDIVGYSKQPQEAQTRLVEALTQAVRALLEVSRAEARHELLIFPTGDGMALAFFRNPLSPLQCAVELARTLTPRNDLPLRMGIHSGPVTRITGADGKPNLTGGGMNLAQRVMDCGDAGHILLSVDAARVARQFETWRELLHDLGECAVKHGVSLHLFNLCAPPAGNPERPSKLPDTANVPGLPAAMPISAKSVAILYKRNAPHSAHLLDVLHAGLTAAGYDVFIDRHLRIGVEWGQELKRQVSGAYAVVPLLSAESIWSEMVEDEVQTAYEAQQERSGLPRLLPVRVAYEGALPEMLEHIIAPLQYVLWRGPEDDTMLVEALVEALRAASRPTRRPPLDPSGGAVPLGSPYYITRRSDTEFAEALARRESILLIKGARQMGKTTLLARGLLQAQEEGARRFRVDFQKLSIACLQSEELFYQTLAEMLSEQLELKVMPEGVWRRTLIPSANFERYLKREVLNKSDVPLVWGLDEVDRLFTCPFGNDVFALLRSWRNDRAHEPEGPWSKLTLAIAYATEAHLFITDVNQSPFNVGIQVVLDDFTEAQVAALNDLYERPLRTEAEVAQCHQLLGGQPYLTRRCLDEMILQSLSFADVAAVADSDEGPFGDHLRRLLVTLSTDADTLQIVRNLLRGESLPDAKTFYRLRSGGLLHGSSEREFRLRCRLYEGYLQRHLF